MFLFLFVFFFKLEYHLFCRNHLIIVWWGLRLARAVSENACPVPSQLKHRHRFHSSKLFS